MHYWRIGMLEFVTISKGNTNFYEEIVNYTYQRILNLNRTLRLFESFAINNHGNGEFTQGIKC